MELLLQILSNMPLKTGTDKNFTKLDGRIETIEETTTNGLSRIVKIVI